MFEMPKGHLSVPVQRAVDWNGLKQEGEDQIRNNNLRSLQQGSTEAKKKNEVIQLLHVKKLCTTDGNPEETNVL